MNEMEEYKILSKSRVPLVEGHIYHIFSKSIAGFKIFRTDSEYERIRQLFKYYIKDKAPAKYSAFLKIKNKEEFLQKHSAKREHLIDIIAYCIMPTHIHFVLRQLKKNGISIFMKNILDSYTRYFNTKTKRKGPLWEGRFQRILVKSDEQLVHLTRYVHLNPVTAYLVDKPEQWEFSSYKEFLSEIEDKYKICNYSNVLSIEPVTYREFVNSQIDYQRELAEVKKLFLE